MRKLHHCAIQTFGRIVAEAAAAPDAEAALSSITAALPGLLGDRDAARRPGNLKEGEHEDYACGCFMVTLDKRQNMLFAPNNFGPQQRHTKIGVELGHPGVVVRSQAPLLLANTDEHPSFVKILETFRAGSAVFAPLVWRGQFLGQIICASQVRNMYDRTDLQLLVSFGHLAATLWIAHGGPALLAQADG